MVLCRNNESKGYITKVADFILTTTLHQISHTSAYLEPRAVCKKPVEDLEHAMCHEKKTKIYPMIADGKFNALKNAKDTDVEEAKYHWNVLEWLIFVDESFASRPDMNVFPTPPEAPCKGNCTT